jgi:hypothetical protein
MGHIIDTLSHGKIEGSYTGTDVRFVKLESYRIPVLSLCETIQYLAETNKDTRMTIRLTGDQLGAFDQVSEITTALGDFRRISDYFEKTKDLSMGLLAALDHPRNDNPFSLNDSDTRKLYQLGCLTHVNVEPDKLAIGEYVINPKEFGNWMNEITAGGMAYWARRTLPTFGKITRQAMNDSTSKFFKQIREMQVY